MRAQFAKAEAGFCGGGAVSVPQPGAAVCGDIGRRAASRCSSRLVVVAATDVERLPGKRRSARGGFGPRPRRPRLGNGVWVDSITVISDRSLRAVRALGALNGKQSCGQF